MRKWKNNLSHYPISPTGRRRRGGKGKGKNGKGKGGGRRGGHGGRGGRGRRGGRRGCGRRKFRRTRRVVTRGFIKLYCVSKKSNKGLKPIRFLRDYFKKFATKKGNLPRRALRKKLRQSLPKGAKNLRRRLNRLRYGEN